MSRNLYMEKLGEKAKLASLHLSNVCLLYTSDAADE